MRLFLSVSGIGDRVVEAGPQATATDLLATLDPVPNPAAPGPPTPRSLRVERSGAVLDPDRPLVELDLRSGDRIAVVPIGPATELDRGPDPTVEPSARVRMLTGPLAGEVFHLPAGVSTVGRAASNDLKLSDPGISRRHAAFDVDAAAVVVTDLGSTNGIRIEGALVDGPTALRSGQRLLLGQSWVTIDHHGVPVVPVDGRIAFDRPQRFATRYQGRTFLVPAPPADEERPVRRGPLAGRLQSRQQGRAYDAVIDQVVADLTLARRQEREARAKEHPSIDDVLLAVRSQTRLWERRLTDPDVLQVRLGLAELPSRHRIDVEPGGAPDLRRRTDRLPSTYDLVDGVPAAYDLGRPGGLTVRGPRDRALPLASAIVGQLVGLNPPDQVGLVLCGDRIDDWDWLKWLSHTMVGPDARPRTGADAIELVSRLLDADPDLDAGTDPDDADRIRPPYVVVVVDGVTADAPIVERLRSEGASRGVHPIVLDTTTAPDDGVERGGVADDHAPFGAVLTVTRSTARLTVGEGAGIDSIAVEELSGESAVELGRLLAPLEMGHTPAADDDAVESAVDREPVEARSIAIDRLALGSPPAQPDLGPVDLFELPRSSGDSRLVLGRVAMPDGGETVLAFNPTRDGTLALIGPPGSERSGCLLTVAASAARLGVPDDQQPEVYAFGHGDSLRALAAVPTVVAVTGDDADQAIETLAEIEQRLDDRLVTLDLAGATDLDGFRAARPEVPLRRVLVLIDGVDRLTSLLEPDHPGRTREVVGQLLEIGSGLGVHLVFAADEREAVDPLLGPKVGRWLEIDTAVDRPGRVRLDGAAVRFAVPGGSWEPDAIERALADAFGGALAPASGG